MGADMWYQISRVCSVSDLHMGVVWSSYSLKRSEMGVGEGLFPTLWQDEPNLSWVNKTLFGFFQTFPEECMPSPPSYVWFYLAIHKLFTAKNPFYNFLPMSLILRRTFIHKLQVGLFNSLWITYDQQKKKIPAKSKRMWDFTHIKHNFS